jgi:type II secretory pathway pseudopilin PulG
MLRLLRRTNGFTVAETTIILSTVSILAAAAAPTLGDYLNEARVTRARDDVRTIATAVARLTGDVLSRGSAPGGVNTLTVAVTPGDAPTLGSGVDRSFGLAADAADTGQLNDHLVANTVGYPLPGADLPRGIRGWNGPYLDRPLGADPWGRRYILRFGRGHAATVVLSAGPDGVISTIDAPTGLAVGGDDIVSVLSGR